MKLTYVGPFDEVEIPAAGHTVEQGETFDTDPDLGVQLLLQVENFQAADDEAARALADHLEALAQVEVAAAEPVVDLTTLTPAKLRKYAEARDIPIGDAKTKTELIDVIGAHGNDIVKES